MTIKVYKIKSDVILTVDDLTVDHMIWELIQRLVKDCQYNRGLMTDGFSLQELSVTNYSDMPYLDEIKL